MRRAIVSPTVGNQFTSHADVSTSRSRMHKSTLNISTPPVLLWFASTICRWRIAIAGGLARDDLYECFLSTMLVCFSIGTPGLSPWSTHIKYGVRYGHARRLRLTRIMNDFVDFSLALSVFKCWLILWDNTFRHFKGCLHTFLNVLFSIESVSNFTYTQNWGVGYILISWHSPSFPRHMTIFMYILPKHSGESRSQSSVTPPMAHTKFVKSPTWMKWRTSALSAESEHHDRAVMDDSVACVSDSSTAVSHPAWWRCWGTNCCVHIWRVWRDWSSW